MRYTVRPWRYLLPLLLLTMAPPVAAQLAASDVPAASASSTSLSGGPTVGSATLGYRDDAPASTEMTWNNRASSGRQTGEVLAIVGGAALIGGLLIGNDAGTAIAVGGLVMGLIGLYMWLK